MQLICLRKFLCLEKEVLCIYDEIRKNGPKQERVMVSDVKHSDVEQMDINKQD